MNFWYSSKIKWQAVLLSPFSLVVGAVANRRRASRNRSPYQAPVIVIGNLSVGGTGKTPMIIWLVQALQKQGLSVGVVSRGYGALQKPEYPYIVNSQSDASVCGDEPRLIKNRTGCIVVVDPQRHRAVRFLLEHQPVDIVISDDGMQHYAMHRDLEILMVDGRRLFGNGLILPSGPLRETIDRLNSVDFIVCKGEPVAELPGAIVAGLRFSQPVNSAGATLDSCPVRVVSGIGNFGSFVASVEASGFSAVEQIRLNDHQKIEEDVLIRSEFPVIITEKDAVKLDLEKFPNAYVLRLDYILPKSFEHRLTDKIEALVNEKSRHHSRPL